VLSQHLVAGVSRAEAGRLIRATGTELLDLFQEASALRDARTGPVITYSRKVFIPLTNLCRDRCGYCTFAREPGDVAAAVVAEAPVGDEHDLLQGAASLQLTPLARDRLEQGHGRDGRQRLRLGFIWLSARLQGSCGGPRPEARAIYKRA